MNTEQFSVLKQDIATRGALIEPIWTLDGMILDGRHRYRACKELGIEPTTREWSGDDPAAFVIAANLARRHLSAKQRRELIKRYLKAWPEKSDRTIAAVVGVTHPTVAAVRVEMESVGKINQQTTTVTADGKKRTRVRLPKKPVRSPSSLPALRDEGCSIASLVSAKDLGFHRFFKFIKSLHPSELTDAEEKLDRLQDQINRMRALVIQSRAAK